jgi:FADH2 O2-dependent halogenase
LEKIEQAGFVHKPGACWTAPHAPPGKHVSILLGEFPPPGATQLYTYNVERDVFDAMLLRHAHELGVKVIQGARVEEVRFEGDRAVGVQVKMSDTWTRELRAKYVVDASGRRCLLAKQLGLWRKDPFFNQYALFSWFEGVEENPPGTEGMLFLHFLGLERAWVWQIPLRNGIVSVGAVLDKADFKKYGMDNDRYFDSLVSRNRNLMHNMRNARRVRPWWLEGDYSYKVDRLAGNGWLMVGDASRFVDPVFSTGVDVAAYSALHAFDALDQSLRGQSEEAAFERYTERIGDGVDAWYDLIVLFYKLQNLFTLYAVDRRYREKVVRILQGNLYLPESRERARELIALMRESYEEIMSQPTNLLRPGALSRRKEGDELNNALAQVG